MPPPLAAAVAVLLALAATAQQGSGRNAAAPTPAPAPAPEPPPAWTRPLLDAKTNKGLAPRRLKAYGKTHYFQLLPPEDTKGTIVFLHGCARLARAFFPYDADRCRECIGLPEHVSHTKQALAAGYGVLVLDPNDARHQCWSSSARGLYVNDQGDVIEAVERFLVKHKLTDKPVLFWGASSGGTLCLKLPATLASRAWAAKEAAAAHQHGGEGGVAAAGHSGHSSGSEEDQKEEEPYVLRIDGIISEVASPPDFGAFNLTSGDLMVPDYPPVTFVRMERDGSDADSKHNVELFRKNDVPADVVTSPIRHVGPHFLSDRSATISREQSFEIVAGLHAIGMLDEDGYVTADPSEEEDKRLASFQWSLRLQRLLPWLTSTSPTLSLPLRTSAIRQALYVAYARHDAVSDYFTACLRFLEERGEEPLEDLVEQYGVPKGKLSALRAFRSGKEKRHKDEDAGDEVQLPIAPDKGKAPPAAPPAPPEKQPLQQEQPADEELPEAAAAAGPVQQEQPGQEPEKEPSASASKEGEQGGTGEPGPKTRR